MHAGQMCSVSDGQSALVHHFRGHLGGCQSVLQLRLSKRLLPRFFERFVKRYPCTCEHQSSYAGGEKSRLLLMSWVCITDHGAVHFLKRASNHGRLYGGRSAT
jgi:hypothetical protein